MKHLKVHVAKGTGLRPVYTKRATNLGIIIGGTKKISFVLCFVFYLVHECVPTCLTFQNNLEGVIFYLGGQLIKGTGVCEITNINECCVCPGSFPQK